MRVARRFATLERDFARFLSFASRATAREVGVGETARVVVDGGVVEPSKRRGRTRGDVPIRVNVACDGITLGKIEDLERWYRCDDIERVARESLVVCDIDRRERRTRFERVQRLDSIPTHTQRS